MQTQEVEEKMEENKMDKNENLKHVQNIVKDMEKYASGDFFIYNGELFPIDENEFCKNEGCTIQQENVCGEIHMFYIMPDGEAIFEGDLEVATIGDYFDDFYDVDYIVDSNKHYKACRVLVAFGGPNIYIDTWKQEVRLEWWNKKAVADIPEDLCMVIDEFFETIYNC